MIGMIGAAFVLLAQVNLPTPPPALGSDLDVPQPEPLLPPVALPWPASVYWALGGLAVLVLLGCWALWRYLSRRRPEAPRDPRKEALRQLQAMHGQWEAVEPYPFSITVSDVLRRYVSEAYRVAAEQRTSPEFLDEVSGSPHFTAQERDLLKEFLERVDLIKFARQEASSQESALLLEQALAFVRGSSVVEEGREA